MGTLATTDDDDEPTADVRGKGRALVVWWDNADDEDRSTLREWVEGGVNGRVIAERLTRDGTPLAQGTITDGLRLLRRHRWDI